MNEVVVPYRFAGRRVETDQTLGEQVVARSMTTIEVVRRCFDRKIHIAELLVGGHRSPHTGVATGAPRVVLPGVGTDLTRLWDGVKDQQLLAGPHVEPTDKAGRELRTGRCRAEGGSHDNHITDDQGWRIQPDLTILDGRTIESIKEPVIQIDDPFVPECRNRLPGCGTQRNEVIALRDVDDPFVSLSVRPIRQAPT